MALVGRGFRRTRHLFLVAAIALLTLTGVHGEILRTQTIDLDAGWNAVFLEVAPDNVTPADIFTGTPIDVAATYYGSPSSAQFMTDPNVNMLRETGWAVWYAPDREDAFLSSLFAIHGQRAFLLHSLSNFMWDVTGLAQMPDVQWQPDAYNFVGFSVVDPGAPTFAQFFGPSPEHNHDRIYRLQNGTWRQVTAPDATAMRSGEAFWIYSDGPSDYEGPLRVDTTVSGEVILGYGTEDLVLRNETDHPLTPTLEHIPVGDYPVPLAIEMTVLEGPTSPVEKALVPMSQDAWTQDLPPLEAEGAVAVPLQLQAELLEREQHESLLKVTSDLGTVIWVPVTSVREDLGNE
jgi:hypothetical protein